MIPKRRASRQAELSTYSSPIRFSGHRRSESLPKMATLLLFFEKFEQTKIGGLATCPEFGKSQRTEYLSVKWLRDGRTAARWRKQIFLKFQRKFRKKGMLMTAATVEKMTCNFCSSLETFLQKWMSWFFVYFWSMNISPRRKTWREKRIGLLRFGIARKNDGVKIYTFFPLGPLICLDCATVHGLRRSWSQLWMKIANDRDFSCNRLVLPFQMCWGAA